MLNQIIKFSVYHKGIVFFITGLVIVWGFVSLLKLPIDAVPDITNNQVQINTAVAGWSAEEIEKIVTFPVESVVRGIPNAKEIFSLSYLGLSQVTIIFDDSMDIYRARQLVAERLQTIAVDLPEGAKPQLGPISTGLGEIYQYVLEFKNIATDNEERFKQLVELRTTQDWFVKPRLIGITGVAEVNTIGGYERQIYIVPDPKKLSDYGISFADVKNAVKNATQNIGGGYIEQSSEQFVVQAVGFLKDKNDILDLPIKTLPNFQTISVRDVAEVQEGKENRSGAATYNGREAVLGTAMMMTGANSRTVALRIEERIEEIAKTLPAAMEIIPLYSRSDLVNATINTVWHNILTGACLVIVILFLLVGNLRAAFITALAIPLALLITIISMQALNISGNLMSLGALDFGIIIDGVVIVVDHCLRKIKEKIGETKLVLTQAEIDSFVLDATTEIRTAAGFGQLILVVVFLPIFALVGIEAKTFQPMATTFISALLGALLLSLTLTPALIATLLRKNYAEQKSYLMSFLEQMYQKIITSVLKRSSLIITGSAVLIGLAVGLVNFFGAEFLPQLKEGALAFHIIRPQNVSLTLSVDLQGKAEKIILEYPEVSHVFSRIGTAEVATDPMGIHVSDTYIILKNFGKGLDFDKFSEELMEHLKTALPAMTYLASQPIQMRFNELLEGSRADLTIKIFGDDLQELEKIGEQVEELIKPISPTSDIELDKTGNFPVWTIEPNLRALQRYGVSKAAVLELVSLALAGEPVGYFFDKDKRFPIMIRLNEETRQNLEVIKKLPVPLFADTIVPLEEIATVGFKETYSAINRDNGYRRATIMVNIRGLDTKTFVEKVQKLVAEKIKLPEGYFIEWGGQYNNLQEATARFAILIPFTLLIVFFMIFMAFKSVKKTLLIFVGIPFALLGGILSLFFVGLPFSISAAVGFIALLGIAVLNGIVLLNGFSSGAYQSLPLQEKIVKGSTSRLRPVLMTALADILGFIPMALSMGIGSEVQRPLAVVIIGGIITSTALTLIVLPTIYYRWYKHFEK
ncbi:MAG: CusA/CzcA family heavy metal efflux RND transporter [Deltaproteobacteria bacterium]|jgi:cobalt-zinc-cadmium resistance protein CzcA|nr:CusA/CzcA family heavy metal efflux RND transporter [Deltaproteobacteria bacterium]